MFDVITVGTASRDVFVKGKHFNPVKYDGFRTGQAMCLPFGAKLDVDEMYFTTGGGATNMAVTFARQGFNTACACKVGEDVSGRAIVNDLRPEKIDTRFIITTKGSKTAYSLILISEAGGRTIIVFRGASEEIEVKDVNWPPFSAKWFYLSGALSKNVIEEVVGRAHNMNTKVALNPSAKHTKLGLLAFSDILGMVDVLILNRAEASKLTGINYEDEKSIFKKLDDYTRGIVVMTEGPKGVIVSDGKNVYQAGIFAEKRVADRTGSGDAFGSGFVAGLQDIRTTVDKIPIETIKQAIRLASANATSVVEHIGAKEGILTKKEFEKEERWQELEIKVS